MPYIKALGVTLLVLAIIALAVITMYAVYLFAIGVFIILLLWGLAWVFKQLANR